jgi:transporter family protein
VWGLVLVTGRSKVPGSLSSTTVLSLTLLGLAIGATWFCYFCALKLGNSSQIAPINKLSVVLVAIFAGLLLDERLSGTGWTGVALIGVGVALCC